MQQLAAASATPPHAAHPALPARPVLLAGRAGYLLGGLAAIAVAALYYRFDPAQTSGFPPCLFHELTGLLCPGCGTQRALHQILHGHMLAALQCNAMAFGALALFGWEWTTRRLYRPGRLLHRPLVAWTAFALVMIFWVARNIPHWPCTLLAP